ncbi:hypothetical protein BRARA_H01348 [Brassica rapa]|uniref:Uncharacterized protein n=1 Tax=Brassica campestris TaxID=3711 RepID=A0A397YAZ6_BRACM|nr:hypothetical protein BRARA_H01348 [Brassica rapa]
MMWRNLRNVVNQNLRARLSQISRRDDAEKPTRLLRPTITESTTRLLRPKISEATEFACILIKPREVLTTMWPCRSRYESHGILLARTLTSLDTQFARGFLGESEATEIEGISSIHHTKMLRRAQQVTYKTRWIFMEQLLRPPILEGTEIELRPSGELLTRRCSQPIEYLGRACMSNKRDVHPRLETTMGFSRSRSDAPLSCRAYHTSCPVLSPSVLIEEAEVGGRIIKFETGFIATRTKGSVILKDGGMVILATICSRRKANQPFKLMGDYREDASARCEMPTWLGRCYVTPWERLCGALIHRALTPLIRPQMGITIQV